MVGIFNTVAESGYFIEHALEVFRKYIEGLLLAWP